MLGLISGNKAHGDDLDTTKAGISLQSLEKRIVKQFTAHRRLEIGLRTPGQRIPPVGPFLLPGRRRK
jgi:hypothetical protein